MTSTEGGCLCGHPFTWHLDVSRGVGNLVKCRGVVTGTTAQDCPCKKFVVYESHLERNEFAKAALIGILARDVLENVRFVDKATGNEITRYDAAARGAFAFADAMIAEAKKRDATR